MLRRRNRRRGLFVKLPSTEVVDVLAAVGFDFMVVDREHAQLGEDDALRIVRHAHARGLPAVVRLPEVERGGINRLLEAGAAGIQLSTVRSVGQVRALRAATHYAPEGDRSISLAHPVAGYGGTSLSDYLAERAAEPPLLVGQIETATTDDPLEEIIGAGLDVAFVGTTDLSVDLGLAADRVAERVEEIAAAAEAVGVELGAFGLDDARVTYEVAGSDLALLRSAAAALCAEVARA
jgi:4-hydroxy-2-oxoheptanedioate aldolase